MNVAIDLSPLITKLMADEEMPLGVLQVLLLAKAYPGSSQAQLIAKANLPYSRQALNVYVKKLIAKEYVSLFPSDPGAKNKEVRLTDKGRAYVEDLEKTVVETLRGA